MTAKLPGLRTGCFTKSSASNNIQGPQVLEGKCSEPEKAIKRRIFALQVGRESTFAAEVGIFEECPTSLTSEQALSSFRPFYLPTPLNSSYHQEEKGGYRGKIVLFPSKDHVLNQ